ncbi:glucose dehydrogenase [FAD, quinone]-like [Daktulosphaira vitifoliae]|uniref:glucose dehydrogenase [FAD, quinone]-like n=1 Tax=Daktulosphaira vitifoliae TaxID=58002 RepID=UPI0021AACE8B|nr:glucose dehydrogenase [FAD, quinone]-like [Daktulosphaira vitifoliae]XP_050521514.1 glucose dehydrogenase [FAD, quinone]-like [Daktulosphaira vitifoliae]
MFSEKNCNQCFWTDSSFLSGSCGSTGSLAFFMSLIDLMIRSQCSVADPCRRAKNKQFPAGFYYPEELDFVVVGGGVAGSVVAARLSEIQEWTVGLLEAGPEEPTATSIPAFSTSALGTDLDWIYLTEPQQHACLNNEGICVWPRGKMIGGTGAMTGMMYSRGHKMIYDNWRDAGNYGWGYEDVLPYFKKSESNKNADLVEHQYHGFDGPISVQKFSHCPKIAESIVKAGEELGYRSGDLNGHNQTGFTIAQAMVENGLRMSTSRAFLRPANNRENLFVKINSRVTGLVLNKFTNRVQGVKYMDKNGEHVVRARKEVILSAGVVGSAQLLMLSGIGPAEDLLRVGVTAFKDLPVGRNLQHHVSVSIAATVNDSDHQYHLSMDAVSEFINNRTGPLASTGLTQTTGFLTTNYAEKGVPDAQLYFDGLAPSCNKVLVDSDIPSFKTNEQRTYVWARPTYLLTKSKGYIALRTANPLDSPIIQPNYFHDYRDVLGMVDSIRITIDIMNTKALKIWDLKLDNTPEPGCEHYVYGTHSYWACVVTTATRPENHHSGTCKMGPSWHPETVVDPELRVLGIPNLRVMDASVFPTGPNCNPMAPIIMVAEKGSDMIKKTWKSLTKTKTL